MRDSSVSPDAVNSAAAIKSRSPSSLWVTDCDLGSFHSKKVNLIVFSRLTENAYGFYKTKLKGNKTSFHNT